MSYLIVNNVDISDLVSGLKVGNMVLVSEDSGRNANGDNVIDIINRKKKLYVTFRPMDGTEMVKLINALDSFVVTATYRDPKTNTLTTITANIGDVEPEYYWIHGNNVLYKSFNLNFIEL